MERYGEAFLELDVGNEDIECQYGQRGMLEKESIRWDGVNGW